MKDKVGRQGHGFIKAHGATIILSAVGLAINIAYVLNSYFSHVQDFSHHLGGNIIDHLIIVLMLPLFFAVGYFVDRYRNAQASLEKALGRETYVSTSLQAVFYPQVRQIEGYQFAARYRSVLEESELGGDNYDVFSLGDNKTALAIADVSGKGLRAAILGAFLKSVIRAYLHESSSLSDTVARISSATYHEHGPDMFVTAFIGVLDEPSGTIRYVNAGHPGPLHISSEKQVDVLRAESMPLGIFSEEEFVEGEIVLAPGDYLILYTDGLYELKNGYGATPETLANEAGRLLPADADTLAERLFANAESRAEGVLIDDVAILALRRNPTVGSFTTPRDDEKIELFQHVI